MADTKITALTALTAADPANDVIPIVDVSDTTMAASGTTKKISVNNILGASGTATLASATITGDLTVDTSTLKVDSTNDRVGIKTASPRSGFALDVLGNVAIGDSTTIGAYPLVIDSLGTVGTVASIRFKAANVTKAFFGLSGSFLGDTSTDAMVATDAAGAGIRFYVADTGVEVARFNSTGNLAFANTKGIDFSATTSGSGTMTSELLNDYEEGTWVPVLATDNVSFTSVGYTIQVGKYTKVGNLVTVTGTIQTNSVVIGSAIGNVWITGLPFTQPSTDAPGGVNCFVAQSWAVDAPLAGYVYDSKIYLVERATSVSSSGLVSVADVATGGSNNIVRFSGHYYV